MGEILKILKILNKILKILGTLNKVCMDHTNADFSKLLFTEML